MLDGAPDQSNTFTTLSQLSFALFSLSPAEKLHRSYCLKSMKSVFNKTNRKEQLKLSNIIELFRCGFPT